MTRITFDIAVDDASSVCRAAPIAQIRNALLVVDAITSAIFADLAQIAASRCRSWKIAQTSRAVALQINVFANDNLIPLLDVTFEHLFAQLTRSGIGSH